MRTIACISTIKERSELLLNTVNSLLPQVDEIFIVFQYEPDVRISHKKIRYIVNDNERGDADKFLLYSENKGRADIWFFCDDDIKYPIDYVEKSLKHLEKHPRAILSYHGRTIQERPILSYYRFSRIQAFPCRFEVKGYHNVGKNGTLGTGVMFFNSGVIDLNIDDFLVPNMADIWVAKFAIEKGVDLVVCPHEGGWIIDQDPEGLICNGIFRDAQYRDDLQTKIYNLILA